MSLTKVCEKSDCADAALKPSKVINVQVHSKVSPMFTAPDEIHLLLPGRLFLAAEKLLSGVKLITAVIDVVSSRSRSIF